MDLFTHLKQVIATAYTQARIRLTFRSGIYPSTNHLVCAHPLARMLHLFSSLEHKTKCWISP